MELGAAANNAGHGRNMYAAVVTRKVLIAILETGG
jgi:hypothetical protein